jgi:Ca2+-binding RTX toxin-like protein
MVAGDKVQVFYGNYDATDYPWPRTVQVASSSDGGLSFLKPSEVGFGSEIMPAAAYDAIHDQTYVVTSSPYIYRGGYLILRDSSDSYAHSTVMQPTPYAGYELGVPAIAVDSFDGGGGVYIVVDSHDSRGRHDHDGVYLVGTPGESELINNAGSNPAIAVGPDHSVYAFWQLQASGFSKIYMRRSSDFGGTDAPIVVGGEHASHVQVAVNPVGGQLYATYTDRLSGSTDTDVMFTTSSDHGATWSDPVVVNDAYQGDQYAPTIAVAPNGTRLFIGFNDGRLHPGTELTDAYGAIGFINGNSVTFGHNFRISSESATHSPNDPGAFAARPNQAVADAHGFYFAWADTRNPQSVDDPPRSNDVWLAKIGADGPQGPYVVSQTPEGVQVNTSVTSATVTFSQNMDKSSFSVAEDVVAFDGNGQSLKSRITGFSWLSDRTLQINFNPIFSSGTYSLVLGPQILSKWGLAQDNDFDSVAGESSDTYALTIPIYRVPRYSAYAAPALTDFKLGPDAVQIANSNGPIELGNRTFTFYGHQYTGQQLALHGPGSLSVGSDNNNIEVLFNATNSATASYTFRDVTGDGIQDLVIDWEATDGSMSFQAVLQLGTGKKQGAMFFNYLDIDKGSDPDHSAARSAFVALSNNGLPVLAGYEPYSDNEGDIGVRTGMGLLIRDDLQGPQTLTFGNSVHVFGSAQNDHLELAYNQAASTADTTAYDLRQNGVLSSLQVAPSAAIYLHGSAGNDQIDVTSVGPGNRIGLDGNSGNDQLSVAPSVTTPAALFGGDGDDQLSGGSGPDALEGGPGNDTIAGGRGNDVYYFGAKTSDHEVDTLSEAAGQGIDRLDFSMLSTTKSCHVDLRSDTALATNGTRTVKTQSVGEAQNFESADGGGGNDLLIGNNAANVLRGNAGNDQLEGAQGNDLLVGGTGSDKLIGGRGDDTYLFSPTVYGGEDDTIVEAANEGIDTLDFSQLRLHDNLTLNLTGLADGTLGNHNGRRLLGDGANFERVLGGAGNDTITGNALANQLYGNGGDDKLNGGGGNDLLAGGDGVDTLFGAAGNDVLYGGADYDTLDGGGGNDRLFGGDGNDKYVFGMPVGNEVDQVFESFNAGIDELSFSGLNAATPVSINLGQNNLAVQSGRHVWMGVNNTFLNLENATGGAGNDDLIGNSGPNRLVGGPGNDTLQGGGGTDQLIQ